MGYVEKNLMPNEKIVFKTKLNLIHVLALPVTVLFTGLFCIFAFVSKNQSTGTGLAVTINILGMMLVVAAIYMIIVSLLEYWSSEFAVTNKRVILKTGIIRRKTVELLLAKIEGLNLDQGIIDRILGSGTISTTGTGGKPVNFKKVDDPDLIRKAVNVMIEELSNQKSAA